jgi:hypothetical protein
MKTVVPFSVDPGEVSCSRAILCILSRSGEPGLRRLRKEEALSRLQHLESGFDLIAERMRAAHADLCAKGAWELTLSSDADEAIIRIRQSMPALRETVVP